MIKKISINKYVNNVVVEQEDLVIEEHRANIFVNGEHYISLMCLPQYLDELTVGFLFSDGVISSFADIIELDSSSTENIFVVANSPAESAKPSKRAIISGFAQGSVKLPFFNYENLPKVDSHIKISSGDIVKMMGFLNKRSGLFSITGAVHSSALVLPDGAGLFFEDIGRHNAVDKIIGKALIADLSLKDGVLLTSGRISSEILIKAAGLGIPALISVSAPTSMAVEIARKINMTLIGFARDNRFNIYSGECRVVGPGKSVNI